MLNTTSGEEMYEYIEQLLQIKWLRALTCITAATVDSALARGYGFEWISLDEDSSLSPPVFLFGITSPGLPAALAVVHCMASEIVSREVQKHTATDQFLIGSALFAND